MLDVYYGFLLCTHKRRLEIEEGGQGGAGEGGPGARPAHPRHNGRQVAPGERRGPTPRGPEPGAQGEVRTAMTTAAEWGIRKAPRGCLALPCSAMLPSKRTKMANTRAANNEYLPP